MSLVLSVPSPLVPAYSSTLSCSHVDVHRFRTHQRPCSLGRLPVTGVVVFALIFCVATLLFVPGLILTVGAGVAFGRALGFGLGLLFGSIAVLAGAFAACVIAFYLGR